MSKEEQETLLQTIRARLEWNEKGGVSAIPDPNGEYNIVERTQGKLIRYFEPTYITSFDVAKQQLKQQYQFATGGELEYLKGLKTEEKIS
jgi:hypothetical protein